jgi:hypothetical protein
VLAYTVYTAEILIFPPQGDLVIGMSNGGMSHLSRLGMLLSGGRMPQAEAYWQATLASTLDALVGQLAWRHG